MTLYRQLITWILAIIILLAFALTAISFTVIRTQIQQQANSRLNMELLYAQSILQPYLTSDNSQSQSISAVVEQLYTNHNWLRISLLLHSGAEAIEQGRSSRADGMPDWLQYLPLFEPQSATRSINHQLEPLARLTITTNTAPLYLQFWQAVSAVITLSLALLAVASTSLLITVKNRLRPLSSIAHRADKICNNQYGQPFPQPTATDLSTIVKAINHLSLQQEFHFKTQAREAAKLREQVYRDNISGLGNRDFFINQLNAWLSASHQGGLALMKTAIIDQCYRHHGFTDGDRLVKQIATALSEGISDTDITLARLSSDEFAVLAPNISTEKLQVIGNTMLAVVNNLQHDSPASDPLPAHVGLLMNTHSSTASTLLAQLDNALAKAAQKPVNPIELVEEPSSKTAFGKQQWKSLLLNAIDNDLFSYHFQPVLSDLNRIYQHEVFTAIKCNGQVYTASQFLGAIEDLGVGPLFDRHVVAQLFNRLNADHQLGPLAVNIANSSISDPAFIRWLSQIMAHNQALSSRLFFELPESSFVRHPDSTSLLCSAIRFYKFRFGVDNYGRYFKSLDYLKEFRPDYVKIDFAYTQHLNDQTKSGVLSSISRTAHSLNIMTIATRVETETQLERLAELFVSGFQGYICEHKTTPIHQGPATHHQADGLPAAEHD